VSLTEDQSRAVGTEGSVAVVAGAGTGKTHMLTERYLHHLLEDGLSPLEVVAVTFTDKASEELRSRIRERVRERVPDAKTSWPSSRRPRSARSMRCAPGCAGSTQTKLGFPQTLAS